MLLLGRRASVDEAVLAELRAIRGEIHDLAEKVGEAATREELDGYVTREAFEAHVEGHKRVIDGWRGWLPIALASVADPVECRGRAAPGAGDAALMPR